ncbi:MAG: dTMP kinase [Verrucomicrobiota bacterium]|nr:dTMP kinase [Verrucomicrobiota bacterium]
MPRGLFITFEGSEGCGKSTQVQRLAARLTSEGRPFILTREPGGTPIGEHIRHLLQFAPEAAAMFPETEVLLFAASRSQLVRETIQPALDRGEFVISDRFFDSTTVYQGVARKLDAGAVQQLNRFAVGKCIPDITFVLDVDVAIARERMMRRVRPVGAPDRMEQEPVEFYERVCVAYRALADRERDRMRLIDASRPVDEIAASIWQTLAANQLFKSSAARNPPSAI